MITYDKPLIDPRPIDPPDDPEESLPDDEYILVVDDCHGIYIPQNFCKRYQKVDSVSQEDWDICLAGPDHEHYWEAWDQILNDWKIDDFLNFGVFSKTYRITLEQDGSLYQRRSLICEEPGD